MAKEVKKKSAKESSSTFHNIMKASVNPFPKEQTEECPECGQMANFVPPATKIGKKLIVTFKCPNEHVFKETLNLK